jgi:hypothetical protein
MIHPARVQLVQQLLSENKFSQRRIAGLAGVSRGSVSAIASGRRPNYVERPPAPDDEDWMPSGPITRCPKCGGRVFAPCRLCHVRDRTEKRDHRTRRIPGRP